MYKKFDISIIRQRVYEKYLLRLYALCDQI